MVLSQEGVFLLRVVSEESRSLKKVIDFVSICQSSATKCVPEQDSTIRGETNDSDHDISY